mmetsp:Transcript_18494/g.60538  ORF Transcript_18494/g.60538 Transcript_18494/m.60538 type:complete len:257 (-) Transcript_18494:154-924(-)
MVERTTLVLPSWSQTLPIHRSPPSCSSAFRGLMQPIPSAIKMQTRLRSAIVHTPSAARRMHRSEPLDPVAPDVARGAFETGRKSRLPEPRATSFSEHVSGSARPGINSWPVTEWVSLAYGLRENTMPRPTEKKRSIHANRYRPITEKASPNACGSSFVRDHWRNRGTTRTNGMAPQLAKPTLITRIWRCGGCSRSRAPARRPSRAPSAMCSVATIGTGHQRASFDAEKKLYRERHRTGFVSLMQKRERRPLMLPSR